jgi:hypothetical protein
MTQALIIRDRSIHLSDLERSAASRALEHGLRGVDDKNHRRWLRFLRSVFSLEDGEIAQVGTRIPRCGVFHRHHMAVERAVFDAQQRFTHFEMFRNWVKIGCGFVEWVPGAKGGVVPLPKSIAFSELEEAPMRAFHADMLAFLRGPHAAAYLWKGLDADAANDKMRAVLAACERN